MEICSETLEDAFSWATSVSRTRVSTVDGLSLAAGSSFSTISDLHGVLRTVQTLRLKNIPYEELQENDFVGEGATFSVVKHRYQDNIVAVKFIKRNIVSGTIDQNILRRRLHAVLTEIRILQHGPIRAHPNVVYLMGYGWQLEDGRPYPYLVVEYGSLGSMRPFLKANSKLLLRQRLMLAGDIAAGLTALHDVDVIHGDLKLDNVVLFPTWDQPSGYIARLCDFGHSIFLTSEEHQLWYYGTPLYLPPEAFRQKTHPIRREDLHKCDIWAFGLALWEILNCGETYFQHEWFSGNEKSPTPRSTIASMSSTSEKDRLEDKPTELGETSQTSSEYTKYFGNFDLTRLQAISQEAVVRTCPTRNFQRAYLGPLLKQTLHPNPNGRVSRLSRFPIMTEWSSGAPSNSLKAKLAIHTRTTEMGYDIFRPERQEDIPWEHQVEIFNDLSKVANIERPGPKLATVCFQLMICYVIGSGCKINYSFANQNLRRAVENGMSIARIFQDNLAAALTGQLSSEAHTTFASKLKSGLSSQRKIDKTATLYLMSLDDLDQVSDGAKRYCLDMSASAPSSELLAAAGEKFQMSLEDVLNKTCLFTGTQQPVLSWLEYAILIDDMDVFHSCCKATAPADLFAVGAFGEEPIVLACRLGRTEVVCELLNRGADASPLLYWLFCLNDAAVDCLELALRQRPELSTSIDCMCKEVFVVDPQWPTELSGTPLAFAVVTGSRDLVRKLLSIGANPLAPALPPNDDKSMSEWTAIHLAVKYNHVEILEDILKYLDKNETALLFPKLQLPSALSFLTPVERFGIHGQSATDRLRATLVMLPSASLFWRSSKGVTPLLQAIDFENLATVEALLAVQPRLAETIIADPTNSSSRMLPLLFAAQICARHGSTDARIIPQAVLQAFPRGLFAADEAGLTPLHLAAAANFAEVTRLLISEGSQVNSRDKLGRSPLMLCRSATNVAELLQNNANIGLVDKKGLNAAHHAVVRGEEAQIQLLIKNGVSIEHVDQDLGTPLHYAVASSSRTRIELLLKAGAPVNVPNVNGDTALHIAVRAGRNDVVRLLVQHGADLGIRNGAKLTPLLLAIKQSSAAYDIPSSASTFRSLLEN